MTFRRIAIAALGLLIAALIAAVFVFQDNIVRFRSAPRSPFQTTPPPPAPDYEDRAAWLLWPEAQRKPADVFYVHSTTYYANDRWNARVDDPEAERIRRMIAAPNEAGPFSEIGAVYGPRYREATLFAQFTHKYDGLAARRLAYSDVARAFEHFQKIRDPRRPFFLVGYGQGGLHVLGLLQDYFQGARNPLRAHLAAAYVIGYATPTDYLASLSPPIPPCEGARAIRCVVAYTDLEPRFDEEMVRHRNRSLIWDEAGGLVASRGEPFLCVNPLSWTIDEKYRSPEQHLGAASATGIGYGASPPAISKATGARCKAGILIVDRPRQAYLRRGDWLGVKWKSQAFNLFYFDLAENAEIRLKRLRSVLAAEAQYLDPIGESIDLKESPINKVPPQ